MSRLFFPRTAVATALVAAVCASIPAARGDLFDDIGVNILRSPGVQPSLTGAGVVVAIPEGSSKDANQVSQNDFQINPTLAGITAPITYVNSTGQTATTFPNTIGSAPTHNHPSIVAQIMAGSNGGVSPGVAQVFNYDADYFVNAIVLQGGSVDPNLRVVNQSFVFTNYDSYDLVNQIYDNFVVQRNVVVVSGVGNGPSWGMNMVQMPATAYNVISAGALYIVPGSTGTPDGRIKVDITAPGDPSSYTVPLVSGVAAILQQAGAQGMGGAGTQTAATDFRTVKALMLTGATKTLNHSSSNAMDAQQGAGIVNAYASYRILSGGKATPSSRSSVTLGAAHPAVTTGTQVAPLGWAAQTHGNISNPSGVIVSCTSYDGIDHYVLNLPTEGNAYVLTATLTWNRRAITLDPNNPNNSNWSKLNNLDLFLYSGTTPITSSTSAKENVEQIYFPNLQRGTYDLQVFKKGGVLFSEGVDNFAQAYSLAWSAVLVGDTNWDHVVDILDLVAVTSHWDTSQRSVFNGDLTGDGFVNSDDFDVVASNWQAGTGGAPLALPSLSSLGGPEPATVALLALGCAPLLLRRRRMQQAP